MNLILPSLDFKNATETGPSSRKQPVHCVTFLIADGRAANWSLLIVAILYFPVTINPVVLLSLWYVK
jgi:hypothetical protein